MNNLEYLNSISRPAQPTKAKKSGITGGFVLKLLLGAVVAIAAMIGVSVLINNSNSKATDLARHLYLRMTEVQSIVNNYNKDLKSSELRSINYSLSGTLTGSLAQLKSYLESTKGDNEKSIDPPASIIAEENEFLNGEKGPIPTLENARLNGTLDRNYITQIHMQVSLLLSMITELAARDHNEQLNSILGSLHSNLAVIEQSMEKYSSRAD